MPAPKFSLAPTHQPRDEVRHASALSVVPNSHRVFSRQRSYARPRHAPKCGPSICAPARLGYGVIQRRSRARGVCAGHLAARNILLLDWAPARGQEISFVLQYLSGTSKVRLHLTGMVVRVEQSAAKTATGIAIAFDTQRDDVPRSPIRRIT